MGTKELHARFSMEVERAMQDALRDGLLLIFPATCSFAEAAMHPGPDYG